MNGLENFATHHISTKGTFLSIMLFGLRNEENPIEQNEEFLK